MKVTIKGIPLVFEAAPDLFSPYEPDDGTAAMLCATEFVPDDIVLDLGCGYGVVGIYASKIIGGDRVTMSDINKKAIEYAQKNAEMNEVAPTIIRSDAYEAINRTGFTKILINPPYHSDFFVAKTFIEKGFNRLAVGGCMILVTKRFDWYRNKMTAVFGGVSVQQDKDYYILTSVKKSTERVDIAQKKEKAEQKKAAKAAPAPKRKRIR